ncbi:HK97 gp10 family phage protein [Rhizobium mayense]|uniref:HK97 gp10 family phage protein n=1 Tax=Rhizobium mayense TaxID=1312184 RepID=A0ABT7JNY0_9HYPH|nr:HK97 gp10 family phage protein [Rhizobium mayense]MDL2397458.1 HK97 gp10 family phage protein [Rhizobium mayense]
MASSDFSATIAAWAEKTKQRMEDVVQTSIQLLAEAVVERTPDTGGTPVNSFQVSGSAMPVMHAGAADADAPDGSKPEAVNLAVLSVPLGGKIYMGFTAPYAAEIEYGRDGQAGAGMVRLAAQEWQDIVGRAVRETD